MLYVLYSLDLKIKAKYRVKGNKKLLSLTCIRAFHTPTISDVHTKSCEYFIIKRCIASKFSS